jgi:hypothetical protein
VPTVSAIVISTVGTLRFAHPANCAYFSTVNVNPA